MSENDNATVRLRLPHWVPEPVHNYLAHTVDGRSIRALARESDLHPSTILRQVRRFEARRDDPLVDDALRALVVGATTAPSTIQKEHTLMPDGSSPHPVTDANSLTPMRLQTEVLPVLRRLCEPRAILAVARDMDTAVILREDENGESIRTATAARDIAQAMALRGWITTQDPSLRILRYVITNAGRTAFRTLTAESENRAQGFRDAPLQRRGGSWDAAEDAPPARYGTVESPLVGLARRRDKDGKPFLSPELVRAGERLREDFELCFVGPSIVDDWYAALTADPDPRTAPATRDARDRVVHALGDLGLGLADVALRCCCLLEGLEQTEKKMGWSARSGKIVLRIALQRLARHYEERGRFRPLIG